MVDERLEKCSRECGQVFESCEKMGKTILFIDEIDRYVAPARAMFCGGAVSVDVCLVLLTYVVRCAVWDGKDEVLSAVLPALAAVAAAPVACMKRRGGFSLCSCERSAATTSCKIVFHTHARTHVAD